MISLCGQQEQEELQDPNERLDGTRGKLYVSWCLLSKQKGKYLRGLNIKDDNWKSMLLHPCLYQRLANFACKGSDNK